MVAFVRRFDENYQDAYEQIQKGAIGKPIIIRSQGNEKLDQSPFYKDSLRSSGGIFIDSVIHDIDLSLLFFGENSTPKSVSAAGAAAIHDELAETGDANNAVGICEFWDGKVAYFYHSRTAAHGNDNPMEIFGTAGKLSIYLHNRRNRVELCQGSIKIEALPSWYDRYVSAFVTETQTWVDALLDKKPMPIPIQCALTSLVIATGLQESLKTGLRIHFERDLTRKVR